MIDDATKQAWGDFEMIPMSERPAFEPRACMTCAYWDESSDLDGQPGQRRGYCRVNPPQAMAVPVQGRMAGMVNFARFTWWPDTTAHAWCGRHERDLARTYEPPEPPRPAGNRVIVPGADA